MHSLNLLAGLNPEQRVAVESMSGPVLVLAGAGSGKTRVITVRIAYLLSQGVPPSRILAVTFTNKAANEMRQRISTMVRPDWAKSLTISTFHSFGLALIRKYGRALGVPPNASVIDESDRDALLKQVRQELHLSDTDLSYDDVDAYLMQVKGCGAEPGALAASFGYKKATLLRQFHNNYESRLRLARVLDFDDLIHMPANLLATNAEVRESVVATYDHIMVDEYQDTNWLQFRLLQLLAGENPNICVVGDDDQSIYGWRGARVENILEFDRHFPGCEIVKLTRNYRSEENILKLANAVIAQNSRRRSKELWTENRDEIPARKLFYESQAEEAEGIGDELLALTGRGVKTSDIAVLYRTRGQSKFFQESLRIRGLPYRVVGSFDFFERREVRDILAYWRLMVNPANEAAFRRIVNYPARGVGLATLQKIEKFHLQKMPLLVATRAFLELEGDALNVRTRRGLTGFVSSIEKCHRDLSGLAGEGLADLAEDILVKSGVKDDLILRGQGALKTMATLVSLLRRYLKEDKGNTLQGFLEKVTLDQKEADFNAEDKTDEGATLMTVHSAKGLEFEAVFVAGMVEGLFPHFRSAGEPGGVEEERRLFYVAITRARKRLYLSSFRYREERGEVRPSRPSRYLKELPEELLVKEVDKDQGFLSKDALLAGFEDFEKDLFKK